MAAGRNLRALVCAAAIFACLSIAAAATAASSPLTTALDLSSGAGSPDSDLVLARARAAGITAVRLNLFWSQVAPSQRPDNFNPSDPNDPNYHWDDFDKSLENVVASGFEPIVTIVGAPEWAQPPGPRLPFPGAYKPDPVQYGLFAHAAALRYSGSPGGLPRVRYWQAWNEPNISLFLIPQLIDGHPVSPSWYRTMLHEFATGVRSAYPDNVVIAAGLAPFRDITTDVYQQNPDWGPLSFMRELLCISKSLKPTCSQRADFDIWAMHPYTSGGPTHHAVLANDVSLGDLPEMRRTLNAAIHAGHVNSTGRVRFWVTEFSWDSKPPDPMGVPVSVLNHWVPEALYRMWANGISLVTWLAVRDEPLTTSYYQSGLYFRAVSMAADKRKPFFEGFRFPVVAFRRTSGIYVWGRTPAGRPQRVLVEQRVKKHWRPLAGVKSNRDGIFELKMSGVEGYFVRARLSNGERSLPFSLAPVPDHFYNPFGLPTLLEPKKP